MAKNQHPLIKLSTAEHLHRNDGPAPERMATSWHDSQPSAS
jgi:hypothetical protein